MLRNDVVYVTPIDILNAPDSMVSTIPNFGKYPVSDRAIYGPAAAVKFGPHNDLTNSRNTCNSHKTTIRDGDCTRNDLSITLYCGPFAKSGWSENIPTCVFFEREPMKAFGLVIAIFPVVYGSPNHLDFCSKKRWDVRVREKSCDWRAPYSLWIVLKANEKTHSCALWSSVSFSLHKSKICK
jgi:hypothetical protein